MHFSDLVDNVFSSWFNNPEKETFYPHSHNNYFSMQNEGGFCIYKESPARNEAAILMAHSINFPLPAFPPHLSKSQSNSSLFSVERGQIETGGKTPQNL